MKRIFILLILALNMKGESMEERATFGGGCFWGVEEHFRTMEGVIRTEAGYMGGHLDNPTYREVCTDQTGHAEVVQIVYDPNSISYKILLDHFFTVHNPTQLNRQGPDVGTQYRSVIFYHSPEQKLTAENTIRDLDASGKFKSKIVTAVEEASTFYPAEEYHQKYLFKRGLESCGI
jgi:peptide-methionine (S)-S-oxide reductase